MDDLSLVRFERVPELRLPILFAAWPGMGSVALVAARKLIEKLDMDPIGTVDASEFGFAEGILVRNHVVLPIELPEYTFFAGRSPSDRGDLLLFVADNQPAYPMGYRLARLVLEVANRFGVRRIHTAAALATSISHMDTPRVWGIATHREILPELSQAGVELLPEGHIRGLNGLLLGVAKRMGFEGICLLGELPYYMVGTDNPKSSLAILEKYSQLWGIPMDLSDLREESLQKEVEIEEFIRRGDKESMLQRLIRESEEDPGTLQ
mgnify:CR=1 FL=1